MPMVALSARGSNALGRHWLLDINGYVILFSSSWGHNHRRVSLLCGMIICLHISLRQYNRADSRLVVVRNPQALSIGGNNSRTEETVLVS
jgi:hypothetical protein